MIPQYRRPAAPIPDNWPKQFSEDKEPFSELSGPATLPWRSYFIDDRLQQLIEIALQNNRDLRLATLNVERARAMYRIQSFELLPTVEGVAAGVKQGLSDDIAQRSGSNTVEEYSANLGVTAWEIDFFGRIRSLKEGALEQYLATDYARRGAQLALLSEVASSYVTLAADREFLELAKKTTVAQLKAYDLIKRRLEEGLASQLDLSQARTRVDAAQVDVARYEEQVVRDENALNLLAGFVVSTDLLPKNIGMISPPSDILIGATSDVLLNRPDISQAEHLLKAANANIGAARANLFPRISLTTSIGSVSAELSDLFGAGTGSWSFAPKVVMPIFDSRSWLALGVTKTDRKIAQTRYEKAIQAAFRETSDVLVRRAYIEDQISAQRSLVKASVETERLARLRYDRGIGGYLNVLDAQRSLYAAQQGLIALNLTKFINQIRLYAVMGGGELAAVEG